MNRSRLSLALSALVFVVGCKKEPEATPPPMVPVEEASPELDLSSAVASKSTEVYDVTLVAPESSAPNQQVEMQVTVTAKGGMHVNAEYPINFRPVKTVNSVKYGKEKFDLMAGSKKEPCEGKGKDFCSLTAGVPFTIDVAGPRRIEGVLAFSVCDKNRCLIEKANLGMDVVAK
jgi:hypothetical protein